MTIANVVLASRLPYWLTILNGCASVASAVFILRWALNDIAMRTAVLSFVLAAVEVLGAYALTKVLGP